MWKVTLWRCYSKAESCTHSKMVDRIAGTLHICPSLTQKQTNGFWQNFRQTTLKRHHVFVLRPARIVQWLILALSKGPNRVCVSIASPEDGNRPSFRHVVFCSYLGFRTMENVHKLQWFWGSSLITLVEPKEWSPLPKTKKPPGQFYLQTVQFKSSQYSQCSPKTVWCNSYLHSQFKSSQYSPKTGVIHIFTVNSNLHIIHNVLLRQLGAIHIFTANPILR
jgi:hypothetical protein